MPVYYSEYIMKLQEKSALHNAKQKKYGRGVIPRPSETGS
jgi:hypothetical protein